MFMIYRCLCVCERTCLYITCTLTNLTYSQANAIHILNPLPLQKKALALHLRTVSICLRTGGYWRARGDISICNHSILNLIYLGFLSLPQTKACTHTHTYLHMYACTPYDCVSNKLSLLWRRSFRMRKVSVNSSTGMLTMCNISKQEIIEKIKDLTQRPAFVWCFWDVWFIIIR